MKVSWHKKVTFDDIIVDGQLSDDNLTLTVTVYYEQYLDANVNPPSDHADGWVSNDLRLGEFIAPHLQGRLFYRAGQSVVQFSDLAGTDTRMHYAVANYDGSFREWISADTVTVENGWPADFVSAVAAYEKDNPTAAEFRAINGSTLTTHVGGRVLMRLRTQQTWSDRTLPANDFSECIFYVNVNEDDGATGIFYKEAVEFWEPSS